MKAIYLVLVLSFLVIACTNLPAEKNSAQSAGKDVGEAAAGETPKQCDEAIKYQVLIDSLPKNAGALAAGEPEGNTMSWQDPATGNTWKYSTASVKLTSGDNNIDVSATDTCFIQYLSMAWGTFYEMEGTNGYFKKTTISGNPAWHAYDKESNRYSYTVFVKNRVIVSVEGSEGVTDSDVTSAVNAVDYAKISAAS